MITAAYSKTPRARMRIKRKDIAGLTKFGKKYGGGTIVEMGVYQAESTAILARYFEHVLGIDPWEYNELAQRDLEFAREIAKVTAHKCDNITLVQAHDHQIEPFIGKVDGVYIDAEHTKLEVTRQIELWLPHCTRFIAGHDYYRVRPRRPDGWVKDAVDAKFDKIDLFEDSTWAVRL